MKKDKFRIFLRNDAGNDRMNVDIEFDGEILAEMFEEAGNVNLFIHSCPKGDREFWVFDHQELIDVLQKARDSLMEANASAK